jgi:hypothetical protein
MNSIAELILGVLDPEDSGAYGNYRKAIVNAFDSEPPPYGTRLYGEKFREVAQDPSWFATSLLINAEREAEGSGRLWNLAASTTDPEISACVKGHAVDESRHAKWYVAILDLAFPGAIDESVRGFADSISPQYTAEMTPIADASSLFSRQVSVDDLIQMNIAEIRTAINQKLQLPLILAYAPAQNRSKLNTLLDRLSKDEFLHIDYSARLIQRLSSDVGIDYITDLMKERMRDFNEITCEEVELGVFPLHCSNKKCWLENGEKSCVKKRDETAVEQ